MRRVLQTLCETHREDEFFVNGEQRKTYGDFLSSLDATFVRLDREGISSSEIVVVRGEFGYEAIVALIALVANGNTVIPHTEASLESLHEEVMALSPDHLLDATLSPFTVERLGDSTRSCLSGLLPPNTPGLVVFTSGSTGRPKAIVHDASLLLNKFSRRRNQQLRAIPFLLFDHMGGFNTLLSIMFGGGCIVYERDRSVDGICAAIERHKVTLLPATPTFLTMLLVSDAMKRYDLSSLRMITYGTEVMSERVLRKLASLLPNIRFKQTYGLSEVGVLMTSSEANNSTWVRLIGKGLEKKIIKDILWLKGSSMMLGRVLYDDGEARFKPHTDEWFCTNDLVEISGEYLRFLGRNTDLINVSGLKVYPSEVENCLLDSPYVANAVVFGKKNPLVGQIVVAQIELHEGLNASSVRSQILSHCRQHLDRFKVPTQITFVDEIGVSSRLKKRAIEYA